MVMNKFLSLSLVILSCFLMSARAQDGGNTVKSDGGIVKSDGGNAFSSLQFVRSDGTLIPDGAILIVDSAEQSPFGENIMNSGLFLRNSGDEAVVAAIEVDISSLDAGTLQCCFPQNCQSYDAAGTYLTPTGTLSAASHPQNLRTEWIFFDSGYEGQATARFRVKVFRQDGATPLGYGPTVSVCFASPALTGIKSATVNDAASLALGFPPFSNKSSSSASPSLLGIYDISGRRFSALQKGLNILRYSDGSTRKIMK